MRLEQKTQLFGDIALTKGTISTNTTTAGAVIDTQLYDSVTFFINAETYTDGTYTPLINEADASNMSGENATADADLFFDGGSTAPETAAAVTAVGTKSIAYRGSKRYVTCDIVSTGVTSGAGISVYAVLGNPKYAPVAQA